MIALPGYIDREAWEGFEEMRKVIHRPMTDTARKLIVYELDRIKKAGHCPNAALNQSTLNCWKDVWPKKDKEIQQAASSDYEKTQAYMREQEAHRKGIRRVS